MGDQICRYFNSPGGCRRGRACNLTHVAGSGRGSGGASSPTTQGSSSGGGARGRGRGRGAPPARGRGAVGRGGAPTNRANPPIASTADVPRGACRFYWSTGTCKQEFGCRYRHVEPEGSSRVDSPRPSSSAPDLSSFLTTEALSRLSGSGTDAYFATATAQTLTPIETHNSLKAYLHTDFRFQKTFNVYAFVKLLENATSTNKSWASEDGQLLLNNLATGNGLVRISDVISWSQVSIRAGSDKAVLSFQRGYIPLLRYLTSDFVVKSTLSHLVNALYAVVMEHHAHLAQLVTGCMDAAIAARSFKDPQTQGQKEIVGSQIIVTLAELLFECFTRFKNAVATHPALRPLVMKVQEWANSWLAGISSSPPTFDDPFKAATPAAREHITRHLRGKIERIVAIVDREHTKLERATRSNAPATSIPGGRGTSEGLVAALLNSYVGPGTERPEGPRHDNDFLNIDDIRIAPTHGELTCRVEPFLPGNFYEAPHPLPADSMERLLDIQFRLLREELTAPLRASVQLILDDLNAPRGQKTRLAELTSKGGGKYRGPAGDRDSVMFNVYTRARFTSLGPDRRGISASLVVDAPPGAARSTQGRARVNYWENTGSKRLMQGGLVALVWKSGSQVSVHLGLIASSIKDVSDWVRQHADTVAVKIVFFESTVELRILQVLKRPEIDAGATRLLIEAPVMFEAIRPFLEALRGEPESIPFSRYLVHRPQGYLQNVTLDPPAYSRAPGYTYQLASLFPKDAGVDDLRLNPVDPASIESARQELRATSRLDPSQADAVIEALTREVTLIQGPPGTGKSYTGVELLRVLIANKCGPILMIAFTNHALDHLLSAVLDAGITNSVVRLGSRSADERISEYSLEKQEAVAGRSRLDRAFGQNYRELKQVEEELREAMERFLKVEVDSDQIVNHLEVHRPEEYEYLAVNPPPWVVPLYTHSVRDDDAGEWQQQGRRGRIVAVDRSMYGFWRRGGDLEFLQPRAPMPEDRNVGDHQKKQGVGPSAQNKFAALAVETGNMDATQDDSEGSVDDESDDEDEDDDDETPVSQKWTRYMAVSEEEPEPAPARPERVVSPPRPGPVQDGQPPSPSPDEIKVTDLRDPFEYFLAFGLEAIPSIPHSDRPLDELNDDADPWSCSMSERERLHQQWAAEVKANLAATEQETFETLRSRHAEVLERYNEGKNEARRQLLKSVEIIGATTTGASRLTSLLKGLGPRVMLVEEAGQVLEAHILASLVPSVEHLICIGDPLQLRPTLNNYALSMDNTRGRQVFRFDMSLMERLSTSGLPMSPLDVQRRMRPQISSLIRNTLYPRLQDNELVKQYPHVRGFAKDVFFFSHTNRENVGSEDSASKFNMFEVNIIKDLVLYLLRQGCYSAEGDIVVLCAYLGQLARLREALASEVAVVIDERDQAALDDRGVEEEVLVPDSVVETVKVSKRVKLRTVDNFQGEEAEIVILSLVRNSGDPDEEDHQGRAAARTTIGFLKSENRTNVALSRAKQGLYILGNAQNLASRSWMWRSVIEELESADALGNAFPVMCQRHPDNINWVDQAGQLPRIAPDGGCLQPCDMRLKCGHQCPYKCHSDDVGHVAVTCYQRCTRLCPRSHPCTKPCNVACGDCTQPVANVELPCGHIKASVPCYLADTPGEIPCDVLVDRKLPRCEHMGTMRCSDEVEQYACRARCAQQLRCCAKQCAASCAECQDLNTEGASQDDDQIVQRIKHRRHPCERTLFCEHRCQNDCSEGHACTTDCTAPCRQVCSHTRCKKACGIPCAPCQQPCEWACKHHACPVPCGSVCARLPCDERCEKLLACGHPCPSVCGEPCRFQLCPICASPDERSRTVDLILGLTLDDIDPTADGLDNILIRLPGCGHIFTVETLDGHCDLNALYRREGYDGRWLGLAEPPTGFRKPPTCPTCRLAIDFRTPRYGRAFKSADLGILERNVASRMLRALDDVNAAVSRIDKQALEGQLDGRAKDVAIRTTALPKKEVKKREKKRRTALNESRSRTTPLDWFAINIGNRTLHGASEADLQAWKAVASPFLAAYRKAVDIARTRSAHVHAWEAAFSYLHKREMDAALNDPARAPRHPEEHAMRVARMEVGLPKPLADQRYIVKAFWTSIRVRLILADLAQVWLKAVFERSTKFREQCQVWSAYITFLYASCLQDANIALDTTRASRSYRQAVETSLLIMQIELKDFVFNVYMTQKLVGQEDSRQQLIEEVGVASQNAAAYMQEVMTSHLSLRRETAPQEQVWLQEHFARPAQAILDEWDELQRSIRLDTFYQPVSAEDYLEVVRAFQSEFSHTGHFYQCPNGHTYVIGECGGAMQQSNCMECGAPVGGSSHTLNSTNRRDTRIEQMLREAGAQQSPWQWGN